MFSHCDGKPPPCGLEQARTEQEQRRMVHSMHIPRFYRAPVIRLSQGQRCLVKCHRRRVPPWPGSYQPRRVADHTNSNIAAAHTRRHKSNCTDVLLTVLNVQLGTPTSMRLSSGCDHSHADERESCKLPSRVMKSVHAPTKLAARQGTNSTRTTENAEH